MNLRQFKLFGILGHPLGHTLSPDMQEAAFAKRKVKAFYLTLDLDLRQFEEIMRSKAALLLDGFNVTVPYKEKMMRYADRLTPEAKAVGAVNTVFKTGRQWSAANTDVYGFVNSLKKDAGFKIKGSRCVVLGGGGAARAAVWALISQGAEAVTIVNRTRSRALKIKSDFFKSKGKTGLRVLAPDSPEIGTVLSGANLIVNATSLGLKKSDALPVDFKWVPKATRNRKILFYDLIYRPAKTRFLDSARKKGHRILNGSGMLLYQGAKAFEIWTGKKAPVSEMRQVLKDALKT